MNYRTKLLSKTFFIISIFLTVLIQSFRSFPMGEFARCNRISDQGLRLECWKVLLEKKIEFEGIDKSLDLVDLIYKEDPVSGGAACHDFVHLIGKKAYDLFSQKIDFKISAKTSYCSYGFYHGFMESLVGQNQDIGMARDFCAYIDNQLSKKTANAKLACYHGVGHGWTNVHDENLWGDERAMVYPALAMCERVTSDPHELQICATGVFDSISAAYYNEAYGLRINKADPFWLCKEQKEKYKTPCYMDMAPAITWLGGYKLDKSLAYVSTVEAKYKNLETDTLAEGNVKFLLRDKVPPLEAVKICRNLTNDLYISCISGLSGGFLQFGPPGKEYELGISFCNSDFLSKGEKDICFERIMRDLKVGISSTQYQSICKSLANEYLKYCIQ